MSQPIPPKILRIKRKRNQDPLQALILEDRRSAKRSKPSTPLPSPISTPVRSGSREDLNLIFTLTRTDELAHVDTLDATILQTVLSESVSVRAPDTSIDTVNNNDHHGSSTPSTVKPIKQRKRKFIIPNRQIEEDTIIPNELSDMVNSFLSIDNKNGAPIRKRRTRNRSDVVSDHANHQQQQQHSDQIADEDSPDDEASEYVYDVYQLSSAVPLTTANHPQSQIGYIRFFDEDDPNGLYQSDDEDVDPTTVFSDDEDSNAEDYYQNDYPSDEDAGAYSETNSLRDGDEEDEEENDNDNDENDHNNLISAQAGDYIEQFEYDDDVQEYGRRKSHHELSDSEVAGYEDMSLLPDDNYYNNEDYDDEYDNEYDNDTNMNIKRNIFFPTDEHDAMAIHRDKIFGKLEKMINDMDDD
ncbi:uncharacterized protein RJT21DRAFT_54243 [Scheffersomyces amazonensis]|uniref:uncharacterized protein n=1 Tax=Scheffersomyces amazonensis TaxID=1078765 RepID=UPI00315CDA6D